MKYAIAALWGAAFVLGILVGVEADVVRNIYRAEGRVIAVEQDNLLLRRMLEGKAHRRKNADGTFDWALEKERRLAIEENVYRSGEQK